MVIVTDAVTDPLIGVQRNRTGGFAIQAGAASRVLAARAYAASPPKTNAVILTLTQSECEGFAIQAGAASRVLAARAYAASPPSS